MGVYCLWVRNVIAIHLPWGSLLVCIHLPWGSLWVCIHLPWGSELLYVCGHPRMSPGIAGSSSVSSLCWNVDAVGVLYNTLSKVHVATPIYFRNNA